MFDFMEHPAYIRSPPFRTWMTWTQADSLPSYSSFRQFFRFCAARFASPSLSSYFSRLPILSLRLAAVSFLLFLRLFPFIGSFSLFFCSYEHLLFFDCISISSSIIFLFYHSYLSFLAKRFTFYYSKLDGTRVFFSKWIIYCAVN